MLPDLILQDLVGAPWSTTSLRGRPAVMFCFASWCTCRDQLPAWQRYWDQRARDFTMLAVAQDAQGPARVASAIAKMRLEFPVLVDTESVLARALGFRIVPAGAMVSADGVVRYRTDDDFDIADPRVRVTLETFLAGEEIPQAAMSDRPMTSEALKLLAEGARVHGTGDVDGALALWRDALALDPENFIVRSQIWAAEHPERFWPVVDRAWQERQLIKEGYDGPLP